MKASFAYMEVSLAAFLVLALNDVLRAEAIDTTATSVITQETSTFPQSFSRETH